MSLRFVHALSVVVPSGQKIANGIKTIEIRSWCPDQLPIKNLLIVENESFLMSDGEEELGRAVAWVDIESVHPWRQDEMQAACATTWSEGYYAWVLHNMRMIHSPFEVLAKRKIYFIGIDNV